MFLPDIVEGKVVEKKEEKVFTPPSDGYTSRMEEERRMTLLNNLGRKEVTEDFSDSPVLNQ